MAPPSSPRSRVEVLARLRSWPALAVLVGWTLVLWFSRLRNVLGNDELTGWGVGWRAGVVAVFVGLALAATTGRLVDALVWWTVGFWLVRYRVNLVYAARTIEQEFPELHNDLVNAVLVRPQGNDSRADLIARSLDHRAARQLTSLPADGVIDKQHLV